jgi:hypothetical protein
MCVLHNCCRLCSNLLTFDVTFQEIYGCYWIVDFQTVELGSTHGLLHFFRWITDLFFYMD